MGTISVSGMTREQLLQMQASGRVFQERADNALQPWDIRAPAPVLGEDVGKYRRDLAVKLRRCCQRPMISGACNIVGSMIKPLVYLNRSYSMLSAQKLTILTLSHPASF